MSVDARREQLEAHWDALHAYIARRVGDAALAADIAQDAYLRLLSLPDNTVILNPKSYLFAIASNLIIDHARGSAARHEVPTPTDMAETVVDPTPRAEARMLSGEALDILRHAVETLPPRTREVFELQRFEQLSYIEIAEHLGIARNTVMVHMARALAHCRDAIRAYHESGE
jgi:RNA polymerase sigma factor (sigma-70 family)